MAKKTPKKKTGKAVLKKKEANLVEPEIEVNEDELLDLDVEVDEVGLEKKEEEDETF